MLDFFIQRFFGKTQAQKSAGPVAVGNAVVHPSTEPPMVFEPETSVEEDSEVLVPGPRLVVQRKDNEQYARLVAEALFPVWVDSSAEATIFNTAEECEGIRRFCPFVTKVTEI